MTKEVAAALPYGPLVEHEVYFDHDGPKFFSLRGERFPIYLLAICVDETDVELVFIYVALSEQRFRQVRSGHIPLRDAYLHSSPGDLWWVVENFAEGFRVSARAVTPEDVPADYWPLENARLELPIESAPSFRTAELETMAAESMRSVAAIELSAHGENLTEFPLRGLGLVGSAVQDSLDALAQEEAGEATERGVIAKRITDDIQMSVLDLRAASFVIVIGTDKRGALMDSGPKVERTLKRLTDQIAPGADAEQLVTAMRDYGPRARGKFTNLLRAVGSAGSGIGIVAAPQTGGTRSARMSVAEVVRALQAIDAVEAVDNLLEIPRATLTGSNTRRGTFESVDNASMKRCAGNVGLSARSQIDGLAVGRSSFVSTVLVEEIDFAAEDLESGRKYVLAQIRPLSD